MTEPVITPAEEAVRRTKLDRQLLMDELDARPEEDLLAPYTVAGGPLGDACESLRDLVAHVLMWDEINLAVLSEARHSRRHWSLDSRWEAREVGRRLNASGVAAGRELPVALLVDRFAVVRDALLAELDAYAPEEWVAPVAVDLGVPHSTGSLAQYVMTVPGSTPYWHAAIHLGKDTEVTGS